MNAVSPMTRYFREQANQSRDLATRLADDGVRGHPLEMADRYDRLAREAVLKASWTTGPLNLLDEIVFSFPRELGADHQKRALR